MFKIEEMKWTRAPRDYVLKEDCIEVTTEAHDGQQPEFVVFFP